MGVAYILDRVGKKVGLNASDANQKAILLDYLNEAAQELYEESDIVGSLAEDEFYIQGDKTIALPDNVYAIRAIKERESRRTWEHEDMRPRYRENNWNTDDAMWRVKGYSPLKSSLGDNVKDGTENLQLNVFGTSTTADTIYLTVKSTRRNSFTVSKPCAALDITSSGTVALDGARLGLASGDNIEEVISFRRSTPSAATVGNIQLQNSVTTSIIYAEIPNNRLESRYLIVDVSKYPFSSTADQDDSHTLQVLYKKTRYRMQNDDDEFPAPGYDNVIIGKCMELVYEEQGKINEAILYDKKASRSLARRQSDLERGQNDRLVFKSHNHDKVSWRAINKYRF